MKSGIIPITLHCLFLYDIGDIFSRLSHYIPMIFPLNITISHSRYTYCLPMISPYIQELHLLLLVPFLTQRWLLALGGVGGPVVLLHGFHLGWLRLCGERYRAKRSGDQRRHGTLKGCPSSIFRYLQMIQARIHVKCVLGSSFEHHKIAVSCAIRTNLTFDLKMGTSHDPPKLEGPRGGWLKHKPTSPP